jgi:hypothetical protein
MQLKVTSGSPDGRVPLRARLAVPLFEALHEEADTRRVSISQLLERVLADQLPALAAERVRRRVAALSAVKTGPCEGPGA